MTSREMGKTHISNISCSIKKSGPRFRHDSFHLCYYHGMIKPVLSLYSFLRPSCFLDRLITRHNFGVHLNDLSIDQFQWQRLSLRWLRRPPIKLIKSPYIPSDPSRRPRTWRTVSFAYTISRAPFLRPCSPPLIKRRQVGHETVTTPTQHPNCCPT